MSRLGWRIARFLRPALPPWADEMLFRLAVRGAYRDLDDDDLPAWPPDDLYDFEDHVIMRQGGFVVRRLTE